MKKRILIVTLFALIMSGCQTPYKSSDKVTHSASNASISLEQDSIIQNPWTFIQQEIQIDIPDNSRIIAERDKILKVSRFFENNIARSEPYIYYITKELKARNMPLELALVPLIESAYTPSATSYSKAAGLWQIVPITARQYGMSNSKWFDPRRDFIQSTQTALDLLQYLNQRFDGDWLLTLAAYNAGEGRVKRAIAWNKSKGLPTNYWALNLSKETMQYVPKLIAIADIIKHNQQYHVALPTFDYTNSLVQIDLAQQISLDKIAQYAGISLEELLEYNAGYSKKMVKGPYHLYVPSFCADTLYPKLQQLKLVNSDIIDLLSLETKQQPIQPIEFDLHLTNNKYISILDKDIRHYAQEHRRYSQIIYKVKNGDNLYGIAKRHKVKVSELLSWNKISNANKLKPGDKLTINIKNGSSS